MTEQKRHPNPFIRMAQEAKLKREQKFLQQSENKKQNGILQINTESAVKSSNVPTTKIVRKTGRGG